MESGAEVRIAVATNGGCHWVKGHVDKIKPQPDGTTKVDVIGWDGKVWPNCALATVLEVPQ